MLEIYDQIYRKNTIKILQKNNKVELITVQYYLNCLNFFSATTK